MAEIIAILNGKGGVGKTTTTINLGTALWIMGKRVLLVDADPQCNLTRALDETAYAMTSGTLYEWMLDEDYDVKDHEIPTWEKYEGMDYIPASLNMEALNAWLVTKTKREEYLKERLSLTQGNYDYILIDCAPAVDSLLNTNVLVAADSIVVPTRTDLFGLQSQMLLQQRITDIRKKFRKELPIRGYLLTQWEKTRTNRAIADHFRKDNDVDLFRVPIRKCAACNASLMVQQSLFEENADSTAADDYMMLAEDILGIKTRSKKSIPTVWQAKASEAYKHFREVQLEQA